MRKVIDVTFTGDIQGFEVIPPPCVQTEPEYAHPSATNNGGRSLSDVYATRRDVSGDAVTIAVSG